MAAQMVGAIGLTCTAPAAYYIGTGRLSERAFILWAANWIFAGNQIHFVQLRIHSARASTFGEKFARGKLFLLAQPVFFAALVIASFWRVLPPLVIVAFVPALVRGTLWFCRKPESLKMSSTTTGRLEMAEAQAFPLLGLVNYQEGSVVSRVILKREKGNITVFAFDEGQVLSEHTSPFDALVQVIEGESEVTVAGKPIALRSGDIVLLPAGKPHAVKATTRFKMVLTMVR